MRDWLEQVQRREAARWERAERAGAFVPVGRTVRVGSADVEVVKTFADCTTTAVLYEPPPETILFAEPLSPAELAPGRGPLGTKIDGVHVQGLKPVFPSRRFVVLAFRLFAGREATPLAVAVERRRTAAYDRFLGEAPAPIEGDGVRVTLLDAQAGLVAGTVDVLVELLAPDVLGLTLGRLGFLPHVPRGPGPEALWREWLPPSSPPVDTAKLEVGGAVTETVAARAVEDPEASVASPRPEPGWTAVAFPGREPLAEASWSGAGGPPLATPIGIFSLFFDPPPHEAEGVELSIRQLYLFRYGGGETLTLPPPSAREPVSLAGLGFDYGGERLALDAWETTPDGSFALSLRPPAPDWWPDLRVLADGRSATVWSQPLADGTIRYALPRVYEELFRGRGGVRIALRLVGRPVAPVEMRVPLTPPGSGQDLDRPRANR
ncbi:MAG: hypothetical protein M3123_04215 [Actinomycetota bacterium]|nr:hypothetical protein [Actinomycetota bacterium]